MAAKGHCGESQFAFALLLRPESGLEARWGNGPAAAQAARLPQRDGFLRNGGRPSN
jgi:hypothetical protein